MEKIAFCDLQEFEALYEKFNALERDGLGKMAALFYEMALALVQGPLFEDLLDDFGQEGEVYSRRIQHARSLVDGFHILSPIWRPAPLLGNALASKL